MATDIKKIPEHILSVVRNDRGNSEAELGIMTPRELMQEWLYWNGIIGYTEKIIEAYEAFKSAQVPK